jgi:hypothetical protein
VTENTTKRQPTSRATKITDIAGILLLAALPAFVPLVFILVKEPRPGLAVLGVVSGCLVVGRSLYRRQVGWEVLAPACLLLLAILVGRNAGAKEAAEHITSSKLVGMTARVDGSAKMIRLYAECFAIGAMCAAGTFALQALVVGIVARLRVDATAAKTPTTISNAHRIVVLVMTLVVFGAIPLMQSRSHVRHGELALFAAIPATLSMLGIFLAAARGGMELLRAIMLGVAALACATMAASDLDISISTYNAGIGDLAIQAAQAIEAANRRAKWAVAFAVPILIASLVLARSEIRSARLLDLGRPIVASALCAIALAAVGGFISRNTAASILAADVASIPQEMRLAEINRSRSGCDNVADEDILWIGTDTLVLGRSAIGQSTQLDQSTAQCSDLLSKKKISAIGIDERVTYGRLACALEALMKDAQQGEGPKSTQLMYRATSSSEHPGTSCVDVVIDDGGSEDIDHNIVAMDIGDDPMHKPNAAHLGWHVGSKLLDTREAKSGFTTSDLETMVLTMWKAHKSPDSGNAVIHTGPTTSMRTVMAAVGALLGPNRSGYVNTVNSVNNRPVFSKIALARGDREIKSPSIVADVKADEYVGRTKREVWSVSGAVDLCFRSACSAQKKKELLLEHSSLVRRELLNGLAKAEADLFVVSALDPRGEVDDTPIDPQLLAIQRASKRGEAPVLETISVTSKAEGPLHDDDIMPVVNTAKDALRACGAFVLTTTVPWNAVDQTWDVKAITVSPFPVPFEIDARGFVWPQNEVTTNEARKNLGEVERPCVVGVLGTLRFPPASTVTSATLTLRYASASSAQKR